MLTYLYLRPLFTNRRSTAPVSTTRRTSDHFPDALTTRVDRPVLGLVGGDSALRAGETQNRAMSSLSVVSERNHDEQSSGFREHRALERTRDRRRQLTDRQFRTISMGTTDVVPIRSGKDIGVVVSAFAGASSALRTQRGPACAGRCMCMTDSRSDSERTAGSSEQSPQTTRDCRPGGGSFVARCQPQLTVAANQQNRIGAAQEDNVGAAGAQVGLGGMLAEARIDLDVWFRQTRDPNGPGGSECTPDELRHGMRVFYGSGEQPGAERAMQDGAIGFEVIRGIASSNEGLRGERNRERVTGLLRRFRVLDGGKKEATAS